MRDPAGTGARRLQIYTDMLAAEIIEMARAYARENPEQSGFARELIRAIQRIEEEFEGEEREALLSAAYSALEQQKRLDETRRATRDALERIKASQEQLITDLIKIVAFRPPGTTIH